MPNDPKSVRLDELGYTDLSDSFEEMKIRAAYRSSIIPIFTMVTMKPFQKVMDRPPPPTLLSLITKESFSYVGRIDDSERPEYVKTHEARDALDALLEGRPIAVPRTKSFGCSVKWGGKEVSVNRHGQGRSGAGER